MLRHRVQGTALQEGMSSLLVHGAELVKNGITTMAEVARVTRTLEAEE